MPQPTLRERTARAPLLLLLIATSVVLAMGTRLALADEGVAVTATVDSREVPAGEGFQYTISVQGAGMSGVSPSTPAGLTNLQLASGPSSSTSFSFINGAVSSSKSFSWVLVAQAEGKARIPALDVKVGDKIYRTEPIELNVTAAGSGRRRQPPQRMLPGGSASDPGLSDLRLENEVSAERVYVGQPVILTTRLLTRVTVVDVSPGPDPTLPGFLLEESETNVVPERVFREGREYQSYILMKRILTPTTAGKTTVPAETRTIRVRGQGRDLFNSFFAPRVLELARSTQPILIEAMAPPAAGRPADFSGAVGSFRLLAVADRAEASVGEAVGLKVELTGDGNLKTVTPVIAPSADFRIFDPRVEESASGLRPRIYKKSWSYVLTPLSPGSQQLPIVSFTVFDPEAKAYRKLSSPVAALLVKRPGPGAPAESTLAATGREVRTLQRDIRFLKPLDAPLRGGPRPLQSRGWIWGALGFAVLAQPVGWFLGRKGGAAVLVPGGRRGRARRRALNEIARARASGGADPSRASSAASSAILRFVSERCAVPASGLTYDEINEELGRRGVSPRLREELRSLLELCDLDRFAPEARRAGGGPELLSRARELVERLDREIGKAA